MALWVLSDDTGKAADEYDDDDGGGDDEDEEEEDEEEEEEEEEEEDSCPGEEDIVLRPHCKGLGKKSEDAGPTAERTRFLLEFPS